jgi:hypothetical protein
VQPCCCLERSRSGTGAISLSNASDNRGDRLLLAWSAPSRAIGISDRRRRRPGGVFAIFVIYLATLVAAHPSKTGGGWQ